MNNVDRLQEFFFEAMRAGWATPAPKQPVPSLSGTKSISFEKGELKLLDYYFVAPESNHSYGTTVIWESGIPRWIMHYGGFYRKQDIPLLKAALLASYSKNEFRGGRGPQYFTLEGFGHPMYSNDVKDTEMGFKKFRGHEWITIPDPGYAEVDVLGEHEFFGGLL